MLDIPTRATSNQPSPRGNRSRKIEPDVVNNLLQDECPNCDEPDPKITGDGNRQNWAECKNCGHKTEKMRGALLAELYVTLARRWNRNAQHAG